MRVLLAASLIAIAAAASANPPGGNSGGSISPSVTTQDFDVAAEYRKGVEALKGSQFVDAKKSFARVLDVNPRDATTNFLAGMADAGLNDLKGAQKHYLKAVKADSKLILAQRELAITSAKLGDREKADAALAALKQLDASCAGACADAQNLKDAIAAVEAALTQPTQASLQTQPPLLFASEEAGDRAYLDAVGLINEGRYQQAIETLGRARATFGSHPDILTYLGFANRKLHRYAIAEDYYRQALAAAPEHKGATEYYGELMVERGNLAGARKMLARLDSICTFGCAEADELRKWISEKSGTSF